jgi:hypothetical protein
MVALTGEINWYVRASAGQLFVWDDILPNWEIIPYSQLATPSSFQYLTLPSLELVKSYRDLGSIINNHA